MSLDNQIEDLFHTFDAEADDLLDQIIVAQDEKATVLLANGLAIRLVGWLIGPKAGPEEHSQIATSLVTELMTLRRNINNMTEDQ